MRRDFTAVYSLTSKALMFPPLARGPDRCTELTASSKQSSRPSQRKLRRSQADQRRAQADGDLHVRRAADQLAVPAEASRPSRVQSRSRLSLAIDRGWLWVHQSGTYVKLTVGAEQFA